jgi:hypothetical protein
MKNRGLKYLAVVVCVSLLASCGKNGGGGEPTPPTPPRDGYEAPAAPTEVDALNTFAIDFWSRLNGDKLLKKGASYSDITAHVKAETTTSLFMLDRIDMTLGEPSPLVDIAVKTRYVPFFAPTNATKYTSEGTGIIVRKPVSVFAGRIFEDGMIVSGCNLSLSLRQTREVSVVTCKIGSATQFEAVAKGEIENVVAPRVVVGTIEAELEDDFREYLKHNSTNFRISIIEAETGAKPYKLFVLTPVYVVVRNVEQTATGEAPLYRLKLEYLD